MMKFKVTRDSHCMADDYYAPHLKIIEFDHFSVGTVQTEQVIPLILDHYDSMGFSWICCVNGNEVATGRNSFLVDTIELAETNSVYFRLSR